MSVVMPEPTYTADEMMSVCAARMLWDGAVCFVGIGLPVRAAVAAQQLHAPNSVLVFESGAVGAKPTRPPISIGDLPLAETADFLVPIPEIFNYWLQGRRIDLGFLGAAQIDRYGNLNSTVLGDYAAPKKRLPGAGGAPEIATSAGQVIVTARHSLRTFVERVDFVTTFGHRVGDLTRESLGLPGAGPAAVVTDLGVLRPDERTRELTLVAVHPGVRVADAVAATGWDLAVAPEVRATDPPTADELRVLRAFTAEAGSAVHRPTGTAE